MLVSLIWTFFKSFVLPFWDELSVSTVRFNIPILKCWVDDNILASRIYRCGMSSITEEVFGGYYLDICCLCVYFFITFLIYVYCCLRWIFSKRSDLSIIRVWMSFYTSVYFPFFLYFYQGKKGASHDDMFNNRVVFLLWLGYCNDLKFVASKFRICWDSTWSFICFLLFYEYLITFKCA